MIFKILLLYFSRNLCRKILTIILYGIIVIQFKRYRYQDIKGRFPITSLCSFFGLYTPVLLHRSGYFLIATQLRPYSNHPTKDEKPIVYPWSTYSVLDSALPSKCQTLFVKKCFENIKKIKINPICKVSIQNFPKDPKQKNYL